MEMDMNNSKNNQNQNKMRFVHKNFDYQNNMYPQVMLDEKVSTWQKNNQDDFNNCTNCSNVYKYTDNDNFSQNCNYPAQKFDNMSKENNNVSQNCSDTAYTQEFSTDGHSTLSQRDNSHGHDGILAQNNIVNSQNLKENENSTQNDLSELLNTFQNTNNPLQNILKTLMSNNMSNANLMDTIAKLPQISGQNGANLINVLSNLSNKKSLQNEDKIEKYKVIMELD